MKLFFKIIDQFKQLLHSAARWIRETCTRASTFPHTELFKPALHDAALKALQKSPALIVFSKIPKHFILLNILDPDDDKMLTFAESFVGSTFTQKPLFLRDKTSYKNSVLTTIVAKFSGIFAYFFIKDAVRYATGSPVQGIAAAYIAETIVDQGIESTCSSNRPSNASLIILSFCLTHVVSIALIGAAKHFRVPLFERLPYGPHEITETSFKTMGQNLGYGAFSIFAVRPLILCMLNWIFIPAYNRCLQPYLVAPLHDRVLEPIHQTVLNPVAETAKSLVSPVQDYIVNPLNKYLIDPPFKWLYKKHNNAWNEFHPASQNQPLFTGTANSSQATPGW